jgi:hypothetical protein
MTTEEILYKTSKTGTTVFYFVANIKSGDIPDLTDPTWVSIDGYGQPLEYGYFNNPKEIWKIKESNGYYLSEQLTASTQLYVTGYSKTEKFTTKVEEYQKNTIKNRFTNNVPQALRDQAVQNLSSPSTESVGNNQLTQDLVLANSNKDFYSTTPATVSVSPIVIFKDVLIDDMYANIKLTRTFETLDTLKVYNKPINSVPSQEANTGILYGKLEARQLIKDENGNTIKVPLKNVPVGIFNPNDEFPTPSSLNEDGDRFFMNIKENIKDELYFDSLARDLDAGFLRSASQFKTTPEKFKYVTITNENGEFIIYNAPVGSQILVFEVDLFKQGLTYDEIVLNNFPFPTNEGVSLGQLPCYYYNQIPTDVLPAWGTNQSGYTELNVSVNLDLRKWTTYIFPPAAYGPEKLEITTAKNAANTFKIQIRDMTLPGFPIKSLTVAQIENDLERKETSRYIWVNEFVDQKSTLQYNSFGCHVLKLPANLYDPSGYRTDLNGSPTQQKGVWLTAYQFKTYVNEDVCYRTTGGYLNPSTNQYYSHFDLNYESSYSKPWTINYPNKYKIAKKPAVERYFAGNQRTFKNPYIIEEPWFSDGDMVGYMVDQTSGTSANAGGFSIQNAVTYGNFVINRIGQVATRNFMYKYEKDVAWNETYANGFEPYWTQENKGTYDSNIPNDPKEQLAGMSKVNNGEKYQRLECGYGYFMKYNNWPRVFKIEWGGDMYYLPDTIHTNQDGALGGDVNNPGPATTLATSYPVLNSFSSYRTWVNQIYNLENQNLAFSFNSKIIPKNSIDIYRILKSGIDNISEAKNFVISTYVKVDFGETNRVYSFQLTNTGDITVTFQNKHNGTVQVQGVGINTTVQATQNITLRPGDYYVVQPAVVDVTGPVNQILTNTIMTYPGNASFNIDTNKYEQSRYDVRLVITAPTTDQTYIKNGVETTLVNFNFPASIQPSNKQLWTRHLDDDRESKGINTNNQTKDNDNEIYQIIIK